MTEAQFELLLAAMRKQPEELHAIHDALRRLRGISYAVYIILCILAGLAGKDSAYGSGRSPDWLKMKNAAAPAMKREEGGDWSQ